MIGECNETGVHVCALHVRVFEREGAKAGGNLFPAIGLEQSSGGGGNEEEGEEGEEGAEAAVPLPRRELGPQ